MGLGTSNDIKLASAAASFVVSVATGRIGHGWIAGPSIGNYGLKVGRFEVGREARTRQATRDARIKVRRDARIRVGRDARIGKLDFESPGPADIFPLLFVKGFKKSTHSQLQLINLDLLSIWVHDDQFHLLVAVSARFLVDSFDVQRRL